MPTISVDKAALFKELGRDFTTEEFDELCFEFGIELDEDTTDQERPIVDGVQEPPQLKIEVPANRYDMLCFEGISLNLNVFLGRRKFPSYRLVPPADGKLQEMIVHRPTEQVRELISCAILRNIKFTKASYESFIALQDKLHANLARQRTLVSMGTHDLDTLQGPFHYKALPPRDIKFTPLNQSHEMTGEELMTYYEKDKHLGKFLPIIRDSHVYPIIYDNRGVVLSLPPIINSNHSKITLSTRNIFIEMTATDKTKVEIVNQELIAMFSQYCAEPFTVEPVKIVSEHNGQSRETPDLTPIQMVASVAYLNDCTGLQLTPSQQCALLTRMCYTAVPSTSSPGYLDVTVPITRADVLHEADIMEDLAISYGFNKLPRYYPPTTAAIGAPLPINKLTDIVRLEAAMAGWTETLPLILCSHAENFAWLNRRDDGRTAIALQNPKSAEYQIVRTSLLPGLLKTLRENRGRPLPMRIFEASDVALKEPLRERKTRNERRFAAAWYGRASGFEIVHGLLDRLMLMLRVPFIGAAATKPAAGDDSKVTTAKAKGRADKEEDGYWIDELPDDPTFFAGHAANIHLRLAGKHAVIGHFGILHPSVIKKFELAFVVSALEINLEVFL